MYTNIITKLHGDAHPTIEMLILLLFVAYFLELHKIYNESFPFSRYIIGPIECQLASSFNGFNSLITLLKRCLTRREKQEIFTFCLHLPTTCSLTEQRKGEREREIDRGGYCGNCGCCWCRCRCCCCTLCKFVMQISFCLCVKLTTKIILRAIMFN